MSQTRNKFILLSIFWVGFLFFNYYFSPKVSGVAYMYENVLLPPSIFFSIWGLIYSLIIFESYYIFIDKINILRNLFYRIFIAILLCLWIYLFVKNYIIVSTLILLFIILVLTQFKRILLFRLGNFTYGLLTGWCYAATFLNIGTIITKQGMVIPSYGAYGAIALLFIIAYFNTKPFDKDRSRIAYNIAYCLSTLWASLGILL